MKKIVRVLTCVLMCTVMALSFSVMAFAADPTGGTTSGGTSGSTDVLKPGFTAATDCDTLVASTSLYDAKRAWSMYYTGNSTTYEDAGVVLLDKTHKCFGTKCTDTGGVEVYINKIKFGSLSDKEQEKAKSEMLNQIVDIGMGTEANQDINDCLQDVDYLAFTEAELLTLMFSNTKADLSTAMQWFAPFQGTLGVILGIACIIIIALLLISTGFDLVYIGLPMARVAMDGKASEGDKERPFGVSYDAVKVVRQAEEDKGGGNVYFAYFKRRILTYIILAVCILFLISGQIASVIGWLLDLVSGMGG